MWRHQSEPSVRRLLLILYVIEKTAPHVVDVIHVNIAIIVIAGYSCCRADIKKTLLLLLFLLTKLMLPR